MSQSHVLADIWLVSFTLFIVLVKFQFGGPATLHTICLDRQVFFYQRRNVNILLSISPNICRWCSNELSSLGSSFEKPRHVFFRNKKNKRYCLKVC